MQGLINNNSWTQQILFNRFKAIGNLIKQKEIEGFLLKGTKRDQQVNVLSANFLGTKYM